MSEAAIFALYGSLSIIFILHFAMAGIASKQKEYMDHKCSYHNRHIKCNTTLEIYAF